MARITRSDDLHSHASRAAVFDRHRHSRGASPEADVVFRDRDEGGRSAASPRRGAAGSPGARCTGAWPAPDVAILDACDADVRGLRGMGGRHGRPARSLPHRPAACGSGRDALPGFRPLLVASHRGESAGIHRGRAGALGAGRLRRAEECRDRRRTTGGGTHHLRLRECRAGRRRIVGTRAMGATASWSS
jgi:hypothetical protein